MTESYPPGTMVVSWYGIRRMRGSRQYISVITTARCGRWQCSRMGGLSPPETMVGYVFGISQPSGRRRCAVADMNSECGRWLCYLVARWYPPGMMVVSWYG